MGITPQKLAVTIALGIVLGIMPIFGLTTLLCTLCAFRFKLNLPALLLICYLMSPLHLILYIPFIQLGLAIFNFTDFNLTLSQVTALFKQNWQLALKAIWVANLAGMLIWLILAGPLTFLFYVLLLPVLRKMVKTIPRSNATG